MTAGAVHRDRRMPAGHGPALQRLPAPQGRVDAREAAAQAAGAAPVGPLAHPGVRGRPVHAGKRPEAAGLDRIAAAGRLRAGPEQGRNPQRERRGPGMRQSERLVPQDLA